MTETTKQINPRLDDEHIIATDPPLGPNAGDFWRRRLRPFAGRSLSHHALEAEQTALAGVQRLRGQSVSAGKIDGLAVSAVKSALGKSPDTARLQVSKGSGLARSGEDIHLSARNMLIGDIPVMAPRAWIEPPSDGDSTAADESGKDAEKSDPSGLRPPLPRITTLGLSALLRKGKANALPRAAILVAQPILATIHDNPADPDCPPAPRDAAYDDLQYLDGTRLALYFWPRDVSAVSGGPDYRLSDIDAERRNRLAHAIFSVERRLGRDEQHPWEMAGIPLALIGFNKNWSLDFVDNASVSRLGGQPLSRSPLVAGSGDSLLWQARLAQFAEELTELEGAAGSRLNGHLEFLPSVGLLPRDVIDPFTKQQAFFPAGFDISLAPMPTEEIDQCINESAGLQPINLSVPEKIELMLPVPARVYDPELLIEETVNPQFNAAIVQFTAERGEWLGRREIVRRRCDILLSAQTGRAGDWPRPDSPEEELAPSLGTTAPLDCQAIIKQPAKNNIIATSQVSNASTGLRVDTGEKWFVWVKLEGGNSPTGLALRFSVDGKDGFGHAAYWGKADGIDFLSKANRAAKSRGEGFPEQGEWTYLEVDVGQILDERGRSLAGRRIDGIEFIQRGGDVGWAATGKIGAGDMLAYFFSGDLPAGATLDLATDAKLVAVTDAIEDGFGTVLINGQRLSGDISNFKARWPMEYLAEHLGKLDRDGVGGLIVDLNNRLKATNDAVDVGFVRARSDIYRLRQYILGKDVASKLVTSPALADLSIRDESARATAGDLKKYMEIYQRVQNEGEKPDEGGSGGQPTPSTRKPKSSKAHVKARKFEAQPAMLAVESNLILARSKPAPMTLGFVQPIMMTGMMPVSIAQPTARAPRRRGRAETISTAPTPTTPPVLPRSRPNPRLGSVRALGATPRYSFASDYRKMQAASATAIRLGLINAKISARDITGQRPIPGVVERTITIAERIEEAPATKAHQYALAGKVSVLSTIAKLINHASGDRSGLAGIALADLPAPGYGKPKPGDDKKNELDPVTVGELLADQAKPKGTIIDVDGVDQLRDTHESGYFEAAVSAIDNSIALMRLVEGRIDLYNKLVADAEEVQDVLSGKYNGAFARLETIDSELSEARHDLMVAAALLAEEETRVSETNQRRHAIINQYGDRVLFRRPRLANIFAYSPSAAASNALIKEPAVTGLRDFEDQPEELREYIALLHDVPVRWFPELRKIVRYLDRREAALKNIALAQARARLVPRPYMIWSRQQPKALQAVRKAIAARAGLADARRRAILQTNFAAVSSWSLAQLHTHIEEQSSVGDLIEGGRERPRLAKKASTILERIGNVAASLHAEFAEVAPVIRLHWAELLSEFDDPQPLHTLSGLPDWNLVPVAQRRSLQNHADWLFARIDPANRDAVDSINEMIRICLLLSAHAPVDQLIPATLVEPAPAKPGTILHLRLDLTVARIGMAGLIRDRRGRPVASVRTEGIGHDLVQARIIRNFTGVRMIDPAMRIAFSGGSRMR